MAPSSPEAVLRAACQELACAPMVFVPSGGDDSQPKIAKQAKSRKRIPEDSPEGFVKLRFPGVLKAKV